MVIEKRSKLRTSAATARQRRRRTRRRGAPRRLEPELSSPPSAARRHAPTEDDELRCGLSFLTQKPGPGGAEHRRGPAGWRPSSRRLAAPRYANSRPMLAALAGKIEAGWRSSRRRCRALRGGPRDRRAEPRASSPDLCPARPFSFFTAGGG
jgi:hypothetical protein